MSPKPKKSSWIVRARVVKYMDIVCEDCTEEEAAEDPYAYCVDQQEVETVDWDVESVEENV